jgi:hypothetical protein
MKDRYNIRDFGEWRLDEGTFQSHITLYPEEVSTGLFTDNGDPLYEHGSPLTPDLWKQIYDLVEDYAILNFIPSPVKHRFIHIWNYLDTRGLNLAAVLEEALGIPVFYESVYHRKILNHRQLP